MFIPTGWNTTPSRGGIPPPQSPNGRSVRGGGRFNVGLLDTSTAGVESGYASPDKQKRPHFHVTYRGVVGKTGKRESGKPGPDRKRGEEAANANGISVRTAVTLYSLLNIHVIYRLDIQTRIFAVS